jgi:spore maturation protein SpmA/spore maturation protein SpmB
VGGSANALDGLDHIREPAGEQSRRRSGVSARGSGSGGPVLNAIWLILAAGAIVWGSLAGTLPLVTEAIFDSAQSAVQLVIGLVGVMVFFLGLMKIAFNAGLRDAVARGLEPITRRLFPEIPADHPAMSAMVMNMASNVVGLGNAATPFGLKAMAELSKLNRNSGSASNAMVLFLAINSSAVTLLPPLGTIGVRAAAGSADPWAIWMPTLFATTCSTIAAVTAYFVLGRFPIFRHRPELAGTGIVALGEEPAAAATEEAPPDPAATEVPTAKRFVRRAIVLAAFALFLYGLVGDYRTTMHAEGGVQAIRHVLQVWTLPALLLGIFLLGVGRGVAAYDAMIEGGREALDVALRIVPYLVAILVAVAMFRASGALGILVGFIDPFTSVIGVPAEVLPMALMRPLSGSGALGLMSEILTVHGADSFIGMLTSTLMGSTETTFYVLAVYLGAAGVVDGRQALLACLTGDVAGFFGAVAACHFFFG